VATPRLSGFLAPRSPFPSCEDPNSSRPTRLVNVNLSAMGELGANQVLSGLESGTGVPPVDGAKRRQFMGCPFDRLRVPSLSREKPMLLRARRPCHARSWRPAQNLMCAPHGFLLPNDWD
jgi:hypothetical protein